MQLTAQNLPLAKITATTLSGLNGQPAKSGWSIGGAWLNGSDAFTSAEALHAHLMGKELIPSATGKSLVIKGEFNPMVKDTDFLKTIITKRETISIPVVDLNDFAL